MADNEVDRQTASEIAKAVADLTVQAMMFDMDIDWEAGTLKKRTDTPEPFWLKRWREKQHEGDREPQDYEGGGNGRG